MYYKLTQFINTNHKFNYGCKKERIEVKLDIFRVYYIGILLQMLTYKLR